MKFLKQKKIIIVLVASVMLFLGAQKAEAGKIQINGTGTEYENDGVTKPCFCCNTVVAVVDKTYDTLSSIDGCVGGAQWKGNFQFLSQCKTTCPGGSVVLYDSSYSQLGNTYISNRLTPVSVLDPPVTTPNAPVVPSSIDTNATIPGNAIGAGDGIVTCGRAGQQMCKLCDLIKGILDIINYIEDILFGVFILAFMIGGIIYITSSGESSMMEMGKKTLMNAAIGIVIVLASYLIVFTVITYLGTKPDMGMTNVSWDSFDCAAAPH